MPLTETKLSPPRLPIGAVARPRLTERLVAGVDGPLTVVVGPAGSGKTVLVSSWAETTPIPVAWLALASSDATPRRFWTGVALALQSVGVPLDPPGPDSTLGIDSYPEEVSRALGACEAPVALVLDDFHELPAIAGEWLEPLLDQPPPALRLVVMSRRDPPLRVGRIRLSGGLTEIRSADLACTEEETDLVLRGWGVRLAESSIERLWERTEGWMAAVRLAAMNLHDSDSPTELVEQIHGEDALIADYLLSEIVARQTPETQAFLLRTSIVDILNGELAEALTEEGAGSQRLDELAKAGVLIAPVDRRARWFRYHGLFAELLQARLRWETPELVPALHSSAARWFADRGDLHRAISHAIAAADWDLASSIASTLWFDLHVRGALDTLQPLLAAMPADSVRRDPDLAIALAAVSLETAGPEVAHARIADAREAVSSSPPNSATAAALALVELQYARHTGRREEALDAAERILDRQWFDDPAINTSLRSLVLIYLGTAESWTGRVVEATELLRRALTAANEAGSPWLALQALAYLCAAEANTGDIPSAQHHANQAVTIARANGWMTTSPGGAATVIAALIATLQSRFDDAAELVDSLERVRWTPHDRPIRAAAAFPRLVVLWAQGRQNDALDVVREALHVFDGWPVDENVAVALKAWEARLLLALGDRDAAVRILDAAAGPRAFLVLSTRARIHVNEGEYEEAHALLEPAVSYDGPLLTSMTVDVQLVNALALEGLGRRREADEWVSRALALSEPGQLLRPVAGHGELVVPLLERYAAAGGEHSLFAQRVLRLIRGETPAPTPTGLADVLSARERQVLNLLPTLMSNQDIGNELYLSVNTVKTHVRAIYRKLGVDNRKDAVARARELHLLGRGGKVIRGG